jgi:DNA-binding CsgD family transcriptional regulator
VGRGVRGRGLKMQRPNQPKLVGRAQALAELEHERIRSAGSEFRCVLLSADAGLGKTRLATEMLARNERRLLSLSARAYPFGEAASFGLWAEALEGHLRTLPREELEPMCGPFIDDLAALLGSVAAIRGSAPALEPPRLRLLEGLTELLRNLSRRSPLGLFLDDMHLSDPSSWETLHHVARKLPRSAILVVVAVRPGEIQAQPFGMEVLAALEKDGRLRRVSVDPLEHRDLEYLAEAFFGQIPSVTLVDWLAQRSRGNPLFAIGLLQALGDESADPSPPDLRSVPADLVARVRAGLNRLGSDDLATLETLALVGRRVDIKEVGPLSNQPIAKLAPRLDSLVQSRLLTEVSRPDGVWYEIAHPLVQDTIYQSIPAGRRLLLHRQVARGLVALRKPAQAVNHFIRSAEPGDDEAVSALCHALAESEKRGAYREAVGILAGLVELLPAADSRWLDVLDAMSLNSVWLVDPRLDTSPEMAARALREIEAVLEGSGDPARLAAVKFRISHLLAWGTGELEAAARTAGEAVALFDRVGDTSGSLAARAHLALVNVFSGGLETHKPESETVAEAARDVGDDYARIQALLGVGLAATWSGRFGEASRPLQASIDLAGADPRRRRLLSYSLGLAACCAATAGRIEDAFDLLSRARIDDPDYHTGVLPDWATWIHWLAGNYGGALRASREGASWTLGGMSRRRGLGMSFAALACLEMGDLTQAGLCIAKVRELYGERRFFWFSEIRYWAEANMQWRSGDAAGAVDFLDQAARRVTEASAPFGAFVLADLCEAAALERQADSARRASQHLAEIAAQTDADLYRGLASIGAAWALLATGDSEAAREQAVYALGFLSGSGAMGFTARAHEVLGRALALTDHDAAVKALETATATYAECEALWRRDRTLEMLRRLGPAGRKSAIRLVGPESLTRREREIAQLAAKGHSSAAIASRLSIADRTVEWHLSNVYAKLAVDSRHDLARKFAQLFL